MNRDRSKLVEFMFGAVYLGAAGFALWLALKPETYSFYSKVERAAWRFDPMPVAVTCLVMLAELLLVRTALVGRWAWPLWGRALVAAVVLTPWALLCSVFFLHAPGFLLFHIVWLWGLLGVLIVSIVGSLVAALARRLRRGGHEVRSSIYGSGPAT